MNAGVSESCQEGGTLAPYLAKWIFSYFFLISEIFCGKNFVCHFFSLPLQAQEDIPFLTDRGDAKKDLRKTNY